MLLYQVLLCLAFVAYNLEGVHGGSELARGFNEDIDWVTHEEGLKLAKEHNKMIFLLIHKSWCGACKSLKPGFASSKEIETIAKEFIMVNVADDEEPKDKQYSPDGQYIPRIYFLTPNGEVQVNLQNEVGNPSYKFYYPQTEQKLETTKLIYGGDSSVRGDGGGRGCEVRADSTYTIPEHKACKNCWHSKG